MELPTDGVASTHIGTKLVGQRACPHIDAAMALIINQKKVAECLLKLVNTDPSIGEADRADARRQFLKLSRAVTAYAAKKKTVNELKLFHDIEDNDRNSQFL